MRQAETDTMVSLPVLGDLTYREWHAFVNGFYRGLVSVAGRKHEYTKEKHYWRVGFLLGWSIKIGLILKSGPWIVP